MKRVGYIYEKIIDEKNCRAAILEASKKKSNRKNVRKILSNIDYYAHDLHLRFILLDFTSTYYMKTLNEGLSGKTRIIAVPKFYPDQCAHHAIMRILKPIIKKSSYYWSCANMPNRGIKRACIGVERATKHDKRHAKYCGQTDIRHYYPTIPHKALKDKLRRKIKDRKALMVLDRVIDSYHSEESDDAGIPIGNYTSPWFAELFLQEIDWKIKHDHHIRHYIRYADDGVIIDNNKKKMRGVIRDIIQTISSYGMRIKNSWQIYRILRDKTKRGRKIDFVGRCFGIGFTTIRKRKALACMRQSRKIQKNQNINKPISPKTASGFISRKDCTRYTCSLGFRKKYIYTVNMRSLKEVISNESKRKYLSRRCNSGGQLAA